MGDIEYIAFHLLNHEIGKHMKEPDARMLRTTFWTTRFFYHRATYPLLPGPSLTSLTMLSIGQRQAVIKMAVNFTSYTCLAGVTGHIR